MNVKQCVNGHFFDVDSFAKCPHCDAPVASAAMNNNVSNEPKAKKKFFFGKKSKEAETVVPPMQNNNFVQPVQPNQPNRGYGYGVPPVNAAPPRPMQVNGQRPVDVRPPYPMNNNPAPQYQPNINNAPMPDEVKRDVKPSYPEKVDTIDFWSQKPVDLEDGKTVTTMGSFPDIDIEDLVKGEIKTLAGDMDVNPEMSYTQDEVTQEEIREQTSELQKEIKRISANDDGRTMSYFSIAHENAEQKSKTSVMVDPVVGWLVAIAGKHTGDSFNIYAGQNSLGRGTDNRIVLDKDSTVSRGRHAVVIFEPKKKKFYLQPGDTNGLIYLNEDFVSDNKELKKSDVIEIGETKLLLFPLCDENFSWEDFIK